MKKIGVKDNSLLNYIIFLIIGIILFFNPAGIVKFISYIIGALLIAAGVYNLLNYDKTYKNLNIQDKSKLSNGVILITLGFVSILCAGMIESLLRFIIGAWIIYNGLLKLMEALNYKQNNTFMTKLLISIVIMIIGLYVILKSNLVFSMIGLCMIIYSIIEIINTVTKKTI